jgi:hypothetical protein
MKTNRLNTIETAMQKLEALNLEASKNVLGGKIKFSVTIHISNE